MARGDSVADICRVKTYVEAKQKVANSTTNAAGCTNCIPGLRIIIIPTNPKRILNVRYFVRGSFRNITAKRAVQIGAVNSMAKTSASGRKATPYSHPVWPPK